MAAEEAATILPSPADVALGNSKLLSTAAVIRSEGLFWNYGRATFGIEFPCDKRGKEFCGPAMT